MGSESRNASGDRHSQVQLDHHEFCGHLVPGMHGWIEHHASDSEAIVKAENHSVVHTIQELQVLSAAHFSSSKHLECEKDERTTVYKQA